MSDAARRSGNPQERRWWFDWSLTILLAVAVAVLVRGLLVQQFVVEGSSMLPTLEGDERVLVNRLAYRMGEPSLGDLVVASVTSGGQRIDVIKRVVALPGDMIEVRGCVVHRNGVAVESARSRTCGPSSAALRVPTGRVFLLGDNRGGSHDSRAFGPVLIGDLVGRVDIVLWPPSAWAFP